MSGKGTTTIVAFVHTFTLCHFCDAFHFRTLSNFRPVFLSIGRPSPMYRRFIRSPISTFRSTIELTVSPVRAIHEVARVRSGFPFSLKGGKGICAYPVPILLRLASSFGTFGRLCAQIIWRSMYALNIATPYSRPQGHEVKNLRAVIPFPNGLDEVSRALKGKRRHFGRPWGGSDLRKSRAFALRGAISAALQPPLNGFFFP